MNIFVVDSDPVMSAMILHDRHVVKMILESAQMLSTAQRHYGNTTPGLLKDCYHNHPCNIWIRESFSNYNWLLRHYKALCEEYTWRYFKVHILHDKLPLFVKEMNGIPDIGLTKFATAMPDDYKVDDPVESYRTYYLNDKVPNNYWTNRTSKDLPEWLREKIYWRQYKVNNPDRIRVRLVG